VSALVVVMGDQLVTGLPGLPDGPVFLREDWELCTRTRHHKQKITLFLSAMRHFAQELESSGRTVVYERLERGDDLDFIAAAERAARRLGCDAIVLYEPADAFARQAWAGRGRFVPSPCFVTGEADWAQFRAGRKRGIMGEFYQQQRRRLGLLLDEAGGPLGGRWSYDTENRKPMPKGKAVPLVPWVEPDAVTREVMEMVNREFSEHPGDGAEFRWPVTRVEALMWLEDFTLRRLAEFGPYEDAIGRSEHTLWHSVLSPLLNTGLLTPREVVERVIRAYEDGLAPLESVEGFVRQVVGWREFIRQIDGEYATRERFFEGVENANFFGHTRTLAPVWWTGGTGLPPLDAVIERVQRTGWCHHIERLMVAGSLMTLLEVHPKEAYRWFMELFVDSAEWVMRPNVFGMSQFSDGGFFATKPYVSGSSYIRKMSDFPAGDWCLEWDGLYWRFVDRQRAFFRRNPRMAVMVSQLDKMDAGRRSELMAAADRVSARLTG